MRIFLIRHGETVDNVAGLYGGSRDAALTAHGVLQAKRLADSLVEAGHVASHVFSSNLQRAVMTATAVCEAQVKAHGAQLRVTQLAELREKDFGSWEGVKFGLGASQQRPPQTGAETLDAMQTRVNVFLDKYLEPLLAADQRSRTSEMTCIVVAHGIILGVLAQRLLNKIPRVLSAAASNSSVADGSSALRLSWSNTGYMTIRVSAATAPTIPQAPASSGSQSSAWRSMRLQVEEVNCTTHLKNLRKTRGGIGNAAFDGKQKTLDRFFGGAVSKKRKAEDDAE